MSDDLFELEENRVRSEIEKRGAKRILLQLPDGLRAEAPRLAAVIEAAGAKALVSGDPCYGPCDLPLLEAVNLEVDLIVHYGHSEMTRAEDAAVPVIFMEARTNIDVRPSVEKALDLLKPWRKIGLATTVQHVHKLDEAKGILAEAGKTVYIGHSQRMKHAGQVLGCDYSSVRSIRNKVEAFLFVGGGRFHALGLSLATSKPTIVADPFENRAYSIDDDAQKILRKRWAAISEAKEAVSFGVIMGLKPGQSRIGAAFRVKEDLETKGKSAVLLVLREVTPAALMQFPTIDAYVNTACPRIALDDSVAFAKPLLTVKEAYVALGDTSWEDLLKEGMV